MNVLVQPQRLLQALPRTRERAVSSSRIFEALGLEPEQEQIAERYLKEFVRVGLAAAKSGKYWRRPSSGLIIGTLTGTRSGKAFVVPDDERERQAGDLYISERSLMSAMHADKVVARLTGSSRKGRTGAIEAVLFHANRTVVGRFIKLKTEILVSPFEEKFLYEINIPRDETLGALDGDVVTVEITRAPAAGRPPSGRVIEVLGPEDAPGMDLEIIIRKHHLPHVFSEEVEAEADAIADSIPAEETARRFDLRDWLTITIDGETARDFDDAVSLQITDTGRYRLGVHIADVSHYVREGTPLDEEAYRRGTSVYFPERAIPMLPERLSNGICSLNPRVDRLTMSAIMDLDRTGRLVYYQLAPTVIRSSERMTYTAVNQIIVDPDGPTAAEFSGIRDMILSMHELALVLIDRREKRGAIDFDIPEAELIFDDEGQMCGVVRSERNIAHRLIEEFMLLANETVATHLENLNIPSIYRIHEEPDPSKLEEFQQVVESFGHKFSIHGPVPQRGFQNLLRDVAGLTEERMLSYLMLRSMEKARYSEKNEGHFGLAMKTYTHFTSPIRRYPDLIVHRVLREILTLNPAGEGRQGSTTGTSRSTVKASKKSGVVFGTTQSVDETSEQIERVTGPGFEMGEKRAVRSTRGPLLTEEREQDLRRNLDLISAHSSERERAADDAERELMDWRKAEFMTTRVGDDFDAVIVSVKDYGFFVELNEFFIEGLVHISTLDDDLYEFEPRKHRLIGVRKGRVLRLGDSVRVTVDRVDRARHLIDFSLAGD